MPSVDAGPGVAPKEAIDYFRAKGFKVGFDHRDVWGQEHAHAFTVAKAMEIDILEAIRGGVDEALAEGLTYRDFSQQLTPLLQKLGWWGKQEMTDPVTGETKLVQLGSPRRLKTIYDANLRTARAAGQWERIQRTKRTHPYLLYELGPSENHRPEHASWAGILLPADDPWWQTHYPQNGWGCKCRVRQVSKREYERLATTDNYLTEAPPIEYREWTNKRTGETLKVPKGIDPGWDINPGIGRQARAEKMLNDKIDALPAPLAEAARKDLVRTTPNEGKPSISLASMDLGQADGVREVLTAVSAGNNPYLLHGVKMVKVVDEEYIAATDQRGYFALSKRPQQDLGGRSGLELMTTALTKIRDGKPLVFEEEYGIESLWHEVLHNSQRRRVPDVIDPAHLRMMEGLHQVIARQTYPEFMTMMGATPAHLRDIRERGPAYSRSAGGLTLLLRHLGRMDDNLSIEPGLLAKLQEIDINTTYTDTRQRLDELLTAETKVGDIDRILWVIAEGHPITNNTLKWLK